MTKPVYNNSQDAAADIRLVRRLSRDLRERGRTVDDVLRQYNETVRPMHEMVRTSNSLSAVLQ